MDGRAKRGESLAGKTIALAAVLVTLLAAGTLLSACAQQRATSQFAVAQPAIPQKASENNPEAWLDALEQNPIDQSFVDSLAAFAYRSTASVLGDGADGAKANRMYSPLSLYYALALANEGAAGQTRDEIASVLGAPSTVDVPQQCGNLFRVLATDPFSTVDLANSIWMAKDASFEQSFIDTAIGQFYATPFSVEFGTDAADQAMAAWISENTGGTMMTFVLPAEGVSVDDLLADEQRLAQAFAVDANEDEYGFITYVVPKVAFDTELDLIPALERLGMKTPFSDKADFSNLTATPAFISMVKQESHISWDEEGAEASAYTDMGISATSAMIPEGEEVELRLDRPFLFQITSSQGIPLFMGVCGNPAA